MENAVIRGTKRHPATVGESAGLEIAYDIVDEPWGVRRFYMRDPFGRILNILSHLD